MFELIGLVIATSVFFAFSFFVGGVYALLAWLILRGQSGRKRYLLIAAILPPIFAVYIAACSIGFSIFVPGESGRLFGDISEPLPNGYVLQALGKMPDYGHIDRRDDKSGYPQGFGGYVGRIAVEGPLVFGAYSHMYSEVTGQTSGNPGYFVFDTQSGTVQNFDTISQLSAHAGHTVQLTETQFFRSQEISHKLQVIVERVVMFGPPIIGTLLYFFLLLRVRRLQESSSAR